MTATTIVDDVPACIAIVLIVVVGRLSAVFMIGVLVRLMWHNNNNNSARPVLPTARQVNEKPTRIADSGTIRIRTHDAGSRSKAAPNQVCAKNRGWIEAAHGCFSSF